MEDEKGVITGTEPTTQATVKGEAEALNAFQKFMKALTGGEKEPPVGTPKIEEPQKNDPTSVVKSFSEEELSTALEAEKAKWQEEQKKQERLAKLTPEEKEKVEKEQDKQRISALEQKLVAKELHETAVADLSKEGFPVGLAELVAYSSKEEMTASLGKTKEIFKTCLAETITQKLKGKTPAGLGDAANAENALKDQIAKNIRGGF